MSDIMVDLETYDTRSSAAILSIGACHIDWQREEITDPFYRIIDLQTCLDAGLTESESTKKWWDRQGPEARRVFTDPSVSLLQGLTDFATYLKFFGTSKVKLWGNGSDFDNVILTHAYNKLGLDAPWRFYNNRCFRTVRKELASYIQEPDRAGVHHNALDDAMFQASILLQLKRPLARGR